MEVGPGSLKAELKTLVPMLESQESLVALLGYPALAPKLVASQPRFIKAELNSLVIRLGYTRVGPKSFEIKPETPMIVPRSLARMSKYSTPLLEPESTKPKSLVLVLRILVSGLEKA